MAYEFNFQFETETGTLLEVTCEIECERDGSHDTAMASIYNLDTDGEIQADTLSNKDQVKLEQAVQDRGDDNAYDAWQSQMEADGDRMYDEMRDRQMEEQ
jgi:hypothetical protein